MLQELYKIFGEELPERHVFFATEGAPTRAILFKQFGSWVEFHNDYIRYAAVKRSGIANKTVATKPGLTNNTVATSIAVADVVMESVLAEDNDVS